MRPSEEPLQLDLHCRTARCFLCPVTLDPFLRNTLLTLRIFRQPPPLPTSRTVSTDSTTLLTYKKKKKLLQKIVIHQNIDPLTIPKKKKDNFKSYSRQVVTDIRAASNRVPTSFPRVNHSGTEREVTRELGLSGHADQGWSQRGKQSDSRSNSVRIVITRLTLGVRTHRTSLSPAMDNLPADLLHVHAS